MEILQNFNLFSLINLLGALILTSLIIYLKHNKEASKRERFASLLPGPTTLIYFGNALNFVLHPEDIAAMIFFYSKKYGSKYRLWIGSKLAIVLSDAHDVEDALKGNKFLSKGYDFHEFFGRAFGNSTFSGDGAEWKKRRKILQHPLKTSVLENYIDVMNNEVNKVIQELEPMTKNNQTFDALSNIGPVIFSIICKTLFDLKEEIPRNEFLIFRENAGEFLHNSFSLMFCPKLIRTMKQLKSKHAINKMLNKTELAYQKALLEGKLNDKESDSPDEVDKKFIDYLLDPAFSDDDKKFEIVTYSVGGSETLSITISFAFLMLGMYSEIQEKVYDELYAIFGDSDRDATGEDIKKMYYLEQVLKEVMRHYPLVPLVFRTAQEDTTVGKYTIPTGTEVIFNVLELHKNPQHFSDPESFDPEHFNKERSQKLPKGCYLPFFIGSRNCIGKAFAMYEMKIVCSAILRKYRIHTNIKQNDIKLKISFVLSCGGYPISISKRNEV